ncbi:MAG TPA: CYTH domain-containing protein [Candidatus Saccharibacteria bacterium]|nr:CYTH domain-containing protein [Candidatus Saccharibacteria bacterium]HRK94431.1 CYTH domain-containing protein [Candidatus Saccharibacteria bacterium]
MSIENEIKLLGVDVKKVQDFLRDNGVAVDEVLNYRRVVFDTVPTDENAWIRLRTDGHMTTLTYKKTYANAIDGTEEIEVKTDDFERTKSILTAAGLKPRNYQENKREVYHVYDCMITIDFWPLIPPYVEIEGDSVERVQACLDKFEGLYESTTSDSTESVYQSHGIDLRSIDSLTFKK